MAPTTTLPAPAPVDPADPQFMLKTALDLGLSDRQFRTMLNTTTEERETALTQINQELERRRAIVADF